jgi:arylsulfatase A
METDALVGRVMDALEKSGAAENTLVIFTSDNGCAPYIGAEVLEAKGHYPSGNLRGYKGDAWEGGHRIPFIIRWPGVVKPAAVCHQLVLQADLMATFAEILGIKLPDEVGEDSFSILSLLKGKDKPIHENAVNCSLTGVPALRKGEWKLIFGKANGGFTKLPDDNRLKLFNLKDDPGETVNLAENQPERVAEMSKLLEKLITSGRSTPGKAQENDVEVRRYPIPGK